MVKTGRAPPFTGFGLVGAGQIDGIEPVIVPDGRRYQAKPVLLDRRVVSDCSLNDLLF